MTLGVIVDHMCIRHFFKKPPGVQALACFFNIPYSLRGGAPKFMCFCVSNPNPDCGKGR